MALARDILEVETLVEDTFKYSTTQINLPEALAAAVIAWGRTNVRDEWLYYEEDGGMGREDEIHVTVLYGLLSKTPPPELKEIVRSTKPFTVKLGKISLFDDKEDYDVVKIEIESDALRKLEKAIRAQCENENKYPDYTPHCTVAYVKKGKADHLAGTRPFEANEDNTQFEATRLIFSAAGDSDDPKRKQINLDFDRYRKEGLEGEESAKEFLARRARVELPYRKSWVIPTGDGQTGYGQVTIRDSMATANTLMVEINVYLPHWDWPLQYSGYFDKQRWAASRERIGLLVNKLKKATLDPEFADLGSGFAKEVVRPIAMEFPQAMREAEEGGESAKQFMARTVSNVSGFLTTRGFHKSPWGAWVKENRLCRIIVTPYPHQVPEGVQEHWRFQVQKYVPGSWKLIEDTNHQQASTLINAVKVYLGVFEGEEEPAKDFIGRKKVSRVEQPTVYAHLPVGSIFQTRDFMLLKKIDDETAQAMKANWKYAMRAEETVFPIVYTRDMIAAHERLHKPPGSLTVESIFADMGPFSSLRFPQDDSVLKKKQKEYRKAPRPKARPIL